MIRTASGPSGIEDRSRATQNLLLSAYDAAGGSCWIGLARDFLAPPEGKRMIRIPDPRQPGVPIILGWPQARPPWVPRAEPIVEWIDG